MKSELFEKDNDECITVEDVITNTDRYNSEDSSMLEHPGKVTM